MLVMIPCIVCILVKKTAQISTINTYAACPRNWIGVGNKCFYFNEIPSNWTLSQTLCKEQGAELARFDTEEELVRRGQGLVCLFCCILLSLEIERLPLNHEEGSHPMHMETRGTCECVPFADA